MGLFWPDSADVHVYVHLDPALEGLFQGISQKLDVLLAAVSSMEVKVAGELAALEAEVARNTSVDESAIALLQGLKQKLDEAIASGDPAKLQALSDSLGASSSALADAVTANTPAEV